MKTIWVLGDQLNRRIGALENAEPGEARILLIESRAMVRGRPYHRQRLHFVITAMRRFARELQQAGFDVDLRQADTLRDGVEAHLDEHGPRARERRRAFRSTLEAAAAR